MDEQSRKKMEAMLKAQEAEFAGMMNSKEFKGLFADIGEEENDPEMAALYKDMHKYGKCIVYDRF